VPTTFNDTFTFSGRVQDHIGRVGVNYKFGDPVYAPAAAAGMYAKAAPPVVVANWTGFYAGGNVGGSVGRSPSSERQTSPVFTLNGQDSFFLSPAGVIGGVQVGANWQLAPHWVVGLEDDFQASGERDSTTCLQSCSTQPPGFVTSLATIHQNIDWFGTARGRVGWTEGSWMLYGTGGLAYGRVTSQLNSFVSTGAQQAVGSSNLSTLKAGWTAGAGVEVKLIGNWSAKAEYLFVDLGTIQDSVIPSGVLNPDPRTLSYSSDVRDHIFRLGVNYRFDAGPIVARY
jgi:outer membrane immunogenic protein